MLYSKFELDSGNDALLKIAVERYLHKFNTDRKNFRKLKPHEKDFIFGNLSLMYSEKSFIDLGLKSKFSEDSEYFNYLIRKNLAERKFDLYIIEEANDYVFYRLILTYFKNLYFQQPVNGPFGRLTRHEIYRDQKYIENSLEKWMILLKTRHGIYLSTIFDEYIRKFNLLNDLLARNVLTVLEYKYRLKEIQLVSFHIYYFVKLYFESLRSFYYSFNICGLTFVFDVYSFVHIFSRHYMPSINDFDIQRSFNSELPFINIREMPLSFEKVLRSYSYLNAIYNFNEYIILEFNQHKYIIWFDYRILPSIGVNNKVMHIRTFYKIKERRDFDKIIGLKKVNTSKNISFFI